MSKQIKENKLLITILIGFALLFIKDLYLFRVNNFQDTAKMFVLKESYQVMVDSFKGRLGRIEDKIDALLKGDSK